MKKIEGYYTRIPNEVLEAFMRVKLNGTQYRVLIAVARYTFGFNREDHKLSIKFLSRATGINDQHIKKELKTLIEMKIISIVREATFSEPRILAINEDFHAWVVEWYQELKKIPGTKVGTTPGTKVSTTPGTKVGTQETKLKQKYKEKDDLYLKEFNLFWEIYPRKEGKSRAFKGFKKVLNDYPAEDLLRSAENYAIAIQGTEMKFIKKAANFLGDDFYLDYIDIEPVKVVNWRGSDVRLQ